MKGKFILFFLMYFLISWISGQFLYAADIAATLDSADGSSAFTFKESGSTTMASIDSSGNLQIKGGLRLDAGGIECTTSEMLIVDGKAGFGITDPDGVFTVNAGTGQNTSFDISNPAGLTLGISHYITTTGASQQRKALSQIQGIVGSSDISNYQGSLAFTTTPAAGSPLERMRITAAGNVGIGTTAPGASLEVSGDIEASGNIILPNKPAFCAYKAGAGITFAAGLHVFPSEEFDNTNNYNTANGRFTAPVDGIYYFTIHFFMYTTYANTTNNYIGIAKNGTAVRYSNMGHEDYDGGISVSAVLKLDAGDYVNSISTALITTYGTATYNSFEGFLVSGL